MNVSKSTLRVPLIWSGKTKALKHMHRALCQIKTLAVLEFEQDLLAARPVKWCFKGKHIVTVTPDSQICVPSEEKVKHIIHLKMHQICSPALSWHPAKSRHHCASVFSLSVPLVTFTERNKASCQHLLCERALSVQPKSWKLQTSTPQCGQFWQSHVPIRTVTECNSWPNNGTKRKQKKWTHSGDSHSSTEKQVDFCPLLSYSRAKDVHNASGALVPWRAVSSQLQPLRGKANHFNMLRRLSWINVLIDFFWKAT